jgi:vacuolar protein sorting-associated protein 13A/C
MVLTEQQKKELYDAIDYDEDKAAIETAVDMPKDVSIIQILLKALAVLHY